MSSISLVTFSDQQPPLRLQLKVEFTSAEDLSRVLREDYYILGTRAYFCNRPNDNAILSFVGIYFRDQPVSGDVPIVNPTSNGPFTYSTYMGVARQAVYPSNPPQVSFDLRKDPEDICFYVAGGNTSPFGFRSNVVRVPKEAIAAALQETQ
jgi:hypothetical protein